MERALVAELTRIGWQKVLRVPLSGAAKGFKGDVIAAPTVESRSYNFELKSRATGFDRFYAMISSSPQFNGIRFTCEDTSECVVMSLDLNEVLRSQAHYPFDTTLSAVTQKACKSIYALKDKWLGEADILVLKQDRMPFIYIRYSQ